MVNIGNDWDELLRGEFDKPYYLALRSFLKSEYKGFTIYPDMYDIFNALKLTPYSEVKAVILGQDPYHEPKQAHGLAFSVQDGIEPPPSLKNIYTCGCRFLRPFPKPFLFPFRSAYSDNGRPDLLGETGRPSAQHFAYRAARTGEQPPRKRLGNFYRQGDLSSERARKAACIYPLGSKCARKDRAYNKSSSSYPNKRAPKPSFCLQRIFRLSSLLKMQSVPARKRHF